MATTGTFAGTGQSASEFGNYIDVMMNFTGTASVDIEVKMPMSSNWIKIETGITSDYHKIFSSAVTQYVRLNCTAFTDAVEYALLSGIRP